MQATPRAGDLARPRPRLPAATLFRRGEQVTARIPENGGNRK